jgi:hypothetical protein
MIVNNRETCQNILFLIMEFKFELFSSLNYNFVLQVKFQPTGVTHHLILLSRNSNTGQLWKTVPYFDLYITLQVDVIMHVL